MPVHPAFCYWPYLPAYALVEKLSCRPVPGGLNNRPYVGRPQSRAKGDLRNCSTIVILLLPTSAHACSCPGCPTALLSARALAAKQDVRLCLQKPTAYASGLQPFTTEVTCILSLIRRQRLIIETPADVLVLPLGQFCKRNAYNAPGARHSSCSMSGVLASKSRHRCHIRSESAACSVQQASRAGL